MCIDFLLAKVSQSLAIHSNKKAQQAAQQGAIASSYCSKGAGQLVHVATLD
jgi:hypothetical protein